MRRTKPATKLWSNRNVRARNVYWHKGAKGAVVKMRKWDLEIARDGGGYREFRMYIAARREYKMGRLLVQSARIRPRASIRRLRPVRFDRY